jgi:hypothetical protein
MATFILWLILFIVSWPLALLVLVAYPVLWLLLLPFRLVGLAFDGLFSMLGGLLRLPGRLLSGPGRA